MEPGSFVIDDTAVMEVSQASNGTSKRPSMSGSITNTVVKSSSSLPSTSMIQQQQSRIPGQSSVAPGRPVRRCYDHSSFQSLLPPGNDQKQRVQSMATEQSHHKRQCSLTDIMDSSNKYSQSLLDTESLNDVTCEDTSLLNLIPQSPEMHLTMSPTVKSLSTKDILSSSLHSNPSLSLNSMSYSCSLVPMSSYQLNHEPMALCSSGAKEVDTAKAKEFVTGRKELMDEPKEGQFRSKSQATPSPCLRLDMSQQRVPSALRITSPALGTVGGHQECWICYDSERQDAGPLIQPCSCKGDVSSVHHDCLKQWLMESTTTPGRTTSNPLINPEALINQTKNNPAAIKCNVCNEPYTFERSG